MFGQDTTTQVVMESDPIEVYDENGELTGYQTYAVFFTPIGSSSIQPTKNYYTVSIVNRTPKGGTIFPMSMGVPQGGTAIFDITVNPGAQVEWVTSGMVSGNTWEIPNITEDTQVEIAFEAIPKTQSQLSSTPTTPLQAGFIPSNWRPILSILGIGIAAIFMKKKRKKIRR